MSEVISYVDASICEGVENEKCLVSHLRTTTEQKNRFAEHVAKHDRSQIPIEWVVDIADEYDGWFYATAYHYDDTNGMLHVMVPDKENPSFDGYVRLDHRAVRIIECVDEESVALFNKITRDSIVKVRWDLEWIEEEPREEQYDEYNEDLAATPLREEEGKVLTSTARYFVRMSNQLLIEDTENNSSSRVYVILYADTNVKLLYCHKGRGIEDFVRLINDNVVRASQEAIEIAKNPDDFLNQISDKFLEVDTNNQDTQNNRNKPLSPSSPSPLNTNLSSNSVSLKKLSKLASICRKDVTSIIDNEKKFKRDFQKFILTGDLDIGLDLMSLSNINDEDDKENNNNVVRELSKIEKILSKAYKGEIEISNISSPTKNKLEDIEDELNIN